MSHTMKLWERVIEYRLRKLTTISKIQFGFMPERSTMEAIFDKTIYGETSENRRMTHITYDIY
jgi:hypothetical protein